jgi:hypothetical protein
MPNQPVPHRQHVACDTVRQLLAKTPEIQKCHLTLSLGTAQTESQRNFKLTSCLIVEKYFILQTHFEKKKRISSDIAQFIIFSNYCYILLQQVHTKIQR